MPCSDGGFHAGPRLDYIALLCEACGIIEDLKGRDNMSADLRKWWRKHLKADAERRKQEAERKKLQRLASKALSKLTTEEIEALREHAGLQVGRKKR